MGTALPPMHCNGDRVRTKLGNEAGERGSIPNNRHARSNNPNMQSVIESCSPQIRITSNKPNTIKIQISDLRPVNTRKIKIMTVHLLAKETSAANKQLVTKTRMYSQT